MKDKGMDRFTGNMRGEHVKRSRLSSGDQKQKKMEGQCLRRPGSAGREGAAKGGGGSWLSSTMRQHLAYWHQLWLQGCMTFINHVI